MCQKSFLQQGVNIIHDKAVKVLIDYYVQDKHSQLILLLPYMFTV